MKKRPIILVATMFLCSMTLGCQSSDYSIEVKNQSGETLTDVKVSAGRNSFTFGLLSNGRKKGFMDANQKFGKSPPSRLDVSFETKAKGPIEHLAVPVKESIHNSILVIVDSDLKVTATRQ